MRRQQHRRLHDASVAVRHTLEAVWDVTIGANTENDMHTRHGLYMANKAATNYISWLALFPKKQLDAALHHAIASKCIGVGRMGTA